jgi:amidase
VDAGAILVDNINIASTPVISKIMRYEFKSCMNYYLSCLHGSTKVKSLADIVDFNQAHAALTLKYGQTVLLDCQNNTSGTMAEPEYLNALAEREKAIADLDRLFDENNIDVILCEGFAEIAPFTGFPSMTIPIGYGKNKVPIGSYWIARRFDEGTLIKATYAMEQLLGFCGFEQA